MLNVIFSTCLSICLIFLIFQLKNYREQKKLIKKELKAVKKLRKKNSLQNKSFSISEN